MIRTKACDVDTIIIGAGVIGLATARALSKAGKDVLILERNSTIGAGACSMFNCSIETTNISFVLI